MPLRMRCEVLKDVTNVVVSTSPYNGKHLQLAMDCWVVPPTFFCYQYVMFSWGGILSNDLVTNVTFKTIVVDGSPSSFPNQIGYFYNKPLELRLYIVLPKLLTSSSLAF